MIEYTLRFSKPVTASCDWNHGDPELRAAQRRAIKAQLQSIKRKLKRNPTPKTRAELEAEKALPIGPGEGYGGRPENIPETRGQKTGETL